MPLLAFDPVNLTRLGYGGGYYDRTIQQLTAASSSSNDSEYKMITIGIALESLKYDA